MTVNRVAVIDQHARGCYEEALALLEEVDLTLSSSSLYGFVFRAFHRAGHSLDPLIAAMEKSPLSPSFIKSILFFSFVDVNEEARAMSILKVCSSSWSEAQSYLHYYIYSRKWIILTLRCFSFAWKLQM